MIVSVFKLDEEGGPSVAAFVTLPDVLTKDRREPVVRLSDPTTPLTELLRQQLIAMAYLVHCKH